MTLKKWLCIGDEKDHSDKCLFAKVEIINSKRPLFARSSRMVKFKELSVFCNRYTKWIKKYVVSCDGYATNILGDFIKNDK